MAKILEGKPVADQLDARTIERIKSAKTAPKLAIIVPSNDPASHSYASMLERKAAKLGMESSVDLLKSDTSQDQFESLVAKHAADTAITGIIIHSPSYNHLDIAKAHQLLPFEKDVDGASYLSIGRVASKRPAFAAATAQAVVELLDYYKVEISAKHAVIIGRSNIAGKPLANLLINRSATVTVCHSQTKNLPEHTKRADIVVAAVGKTGLVKQDMLSPKSAVIDVGTNFSEDGKVTGDVDFVNVSQMVTAISPVPGGVGPVTTSVLLGNCCLTFSP